jgi:hypothetical protein
MSSAPVTTQYPEEDLDAGLVSIPVSLLQKMSEAVEAIDGFQDELEDYLLSQDASFQVRMRQAREHHLAGKTRSLDELKHELCIE